MHRAHQLRAGQLEDQYKLYCAYSKNASRLFLLLVTLSFYLGLAIYENGQLMQRLSVTVFQDIITSYFVPTPEEYHTAMLKALSEVKYALPVIGTTLYMKRFFSIAPLLFLGLATFYWIYLKLALKSFSKYANLCGTLPVSKMYPWVYNLPIRWDIGSVIWQSFIELFPLIFLLAAMLYLLPGFARFYDQTILFASFGVAPIFVHALIFRPQFLPGDSEPLVGLTSQLLLAIVTIEKILSTDSSLLGNSFFLLMGLAGTEAFLVGHYYLTYPFVLILSMPFGMYNRRTFRILPIMWELAVENYKEPISGYIGYVRDRLAVRKNRKFCFRDC